MSESHFCPSPQAHHTVWRKLRQRAEKPVRTTQISHFFFLRTLAYSSHIKAEPAGPGSEEGGGRLPALTGSGLDSVPVQFAPWLQPRMRKQPEAGI